ncbi:unnamed protein product, partial [Discosporangium mesarthrocarpum]
SGLTGHQEEGQLGIGQNGLSGSRQNLETHGEVAFEPSRKKPGPSSVADAEATEIDEHRRGHASEESGGYTNAGVGGVLLPLSSPSDGPLFNGRITPDISTERRSRRSKRKKRRDREKDRIIAQALKRSELMSEPSKGSTGAQGGGGLDCEGESPEGANGSPDGESVAAAGV